MTRAAHAMQREHDATVAAARGVYCAAEQVAEDAYRVATRGVEAMTPAWLAAHAVLEDACRVAREAYEATVLAARPVDVPEIEARE